MPPEPSIFPQRSACLSSSSWSASTSSVFQLTSCPVTSPKSGRRERPGTPARARARPEHAVQPGDLVHLLHRRPDLGGLQAGAEPDDGCRDADHRADAFLGDVAALAHVQLLRVEAERLDVGRRAHHQRLASLIPAERFLEPRLGRVDVGRRRHRAALRADHHAGHAHVPQ